MSGLVGPLVLICLFQAPSGPVNGVSPSASKYRPMPKELIPLNSPEGRKLLATSGSQEAFWDLAQYYTAQPDLGTCSVASCLMVLNALPVERPVSKPHGSFKLFTAENFFSPKVEEITTRKKVSSFGMSLKEVSRVLETYPVQVECVFAGESTVQVFRQKVRESLAEKDKHVIVNYLRKSLGQETGGHISPIGAYNETADKVLILDTANYKYPWTWVPVDELWKAMASAADPGSKTTRGYVLVSTKSKASE